MHEDLDTPGPAELEQLADNEAGEGRMPNCQHFRRLARKWREDREDRDALRHALLQATTEKARARRAELTPSAERMAYAVALQGDHGITLAPLCKAPACAIQALSPFEGAAVVGLATIAVEAEAISGMQYRLKHVGASPEREAASHTVPVRDAIHGTVEVTKVFPGDVVAEERDLQASAPVGVGGWAVTKLRPHEARCEACGRAVWDGKDRANCVGFLAPCGKRVARRGDCGTVDCLEALAQQPAAVDEAWGGWATQYPGKMPKLYGAEEIARLNWHPAEGQDLIRVVEVDRVSAADWRAGQQQGGER